MTGKEMRLRVEQLMIEHGMNVKDSELVVKICIIYLEAQKDQIKENLNE